MSHAGRRSPRRTYFAAALKRGRARAIGIGLLAVALLTGCGNPAQSTLHPASPDAEKIAWLTWVMTIVLTAIFVAVMLIFAWALLRSRQSADARPPLGTTGFIMAGGVLLPLAVVLPLYIASLEVSAAFPHTGEAVTIRIVGRMWWWEVDYPELGIRTANELHIPAGKPVKLEMVSADVIHSFWVPSLHGKRDLLPGTPTQFWIRAEQPGIYRGQCAEYCGTQHANMAFYVVAMPEADFEDWVRRRQNAESAPATDEQRRGQAVFLRAGCAQCHRIGGTNFQGTKGPDLTHIASRVSLGAGILPNYRGNLAGWVGNAPALKPGVQMPATYLNAEELFELVAYLESLE